jgi:hypothetical protein
MIQTMRHTARRRMWNQSLAIAFAATLACAGSAFQIPVAAALSAEPVIRPGVDSLALSSAAADAADRLSAVGTSDYRDLFGGIAMTDNGTSLVVYLTQLNSKAMDTFVSIAGAIPVRFVRARLSLSSLNALHARVNESYPGLRAAGIPINEYGPDVVKGGERIGVVDLTDAQRDVLNGEFGSENLDVYNVSKAEASSTHNFSSRIDDSSPWFASDVITVYKSSIGYQYPPCTLGFGITFPGGTRGILTAGHCNGPIAELVAYNSDRAEPAHLGRQIGPVASTALDDPPHGIDSPLDVERLSAQASPYLWDGPIGSGSLGDIDGVGGNYVGEPVCGDGGFFGINCTLTVDAVGFCTVIDGSNGCGMVRAASSANFSGGPGDSGGPVFRYAANGDLLAVGLIRGGPNTGGAYLLYTGMTTTLDHYGATLCTVTSC